MALGGAPVLGRGPQILAVLCISAGCHSGSPLGPATPTPSPTPALVTPGAHTGSTEIVFVSADPAPGATIAGCGADVTGCAGRVRMRFRLLSAAGGPVLDAIGFLHATNKLACYRGSTGPFTLAAGVAKEVVVVFDTADPVCGLPAEIATMKLVLSAPTPVDALQEWAVRYSFQR